MFGAFEGSVGNPPASRRSPKALPEPSSGGDGDTVEDPDPMPALLEEVCERSSKIPC